MPWCSFAFHDSDNCVCFLSWKRDRRPKGKETPLSLLFSSLLSLRNLYQEHGPVQRSWVNGAPQREAQTVHFFSLFFPICSLCISAHNASPHQRVACDLRLESVSLHVTACLFCECRCFQACASGENLNSFTFWRKCDLVDHSTNGNLIGENLFFRSKNPDLLF